MPPRAPGCRQPRAASPGCRRPRWVRPSRPGPRGARSWAASAAMRIISAADVEAALDFDSLVERLRQAFRRDIVVPLRHHHAVATGEGDEATLLLMPAWQAGRHIGIKLVTVFPGNAARDLPAVMGAYLLLDGKTGSPLAMIDGPMLTAKRTAAASALAAGYLARPDCERLLMVGTGVLAPQLILAHAAVRPLLTSLSYSHSPSRTMLRIYISRRGFHP